MCVQLDIGVGAAEAKAVEKLSSALRKVHKAVKSLSTMHRGLSRRNVVGPNRSAKSFGSNGTAPATIAEDSVAHVEDAKEDLSRSDRHAKHITSGAHDPDPSLSEGTSRKACYASLCVRVFKRGTGAPAFCR